MRRSQNDAILAHLRSGLTLTALSALSLFQCLNLGGRIFDLRKAGHNITSNMIRLPNGKHVAEYRLIESEQTEAPFILTSSRSSHVNTASQK